MQGNMHYAGREKQCRETCTMQGRRNNAGNHALCRAEGIVQETIYYAGPEE